MNNTCHFASDDLIYEDYNVAKRVVVKDEKVDGSSVLSGENLSFFIFASKADWLDDKLYNPTHTVGESVGCPFLDARTFVIVCVLGACYGDDICSDVVLVDVGNFLLCACIRNVREKRKHMFFPTDVTETLHI